MVDGIFHNAHEVYVRDLPDSEWRWVATAANKVLAESIARHISLETEVRPI